MSTKPHHAAVRHLSRRCPTMKTVIRQVGPCTWAPTADDPFALIVRCVIGQQISGKAADSISARLLDTIGMLTPRRVAKFTDEQFKACGISGAKSRALRAIGDFVLADRKFLPGIPTTPDDRLRERLVSIKGIGPWTVDMFLMFGLGRTDVLPVGDYGVKVGMQKLFGLRDLPKPAEMERLAEPWRPYRSVASWYVWRSLDAAKKKSTS